MLAELYVLSGRDAGKTVDATAGPTIFLGRAATNQLRIRDPQASRVHCRIDISADGVTIQDANSGNGTFVNGTRLEEAPRRLADGDEVRIGATCMKVLVETAQDRERWDLTSEASAGDLLDESGTLATIAAPVRSNADGDAAPGAPGGTTATGAPGGMTATGAPGRTGATGQPRAVAGALTAGGDERPRPPRRLREVIPGYLLEARLGGHGRQGIAVYRALQHALERHVALKVFLPRGQIRREDVDWFLREARVVARLEHPNVVTIHDLLARGRMRVIVMEYLAGGSLAARLDDGRPFSAAETLAVGDAMAGALAYLHSHGVLHRGINPRSILAGRDPGTYKLSNFEDARLPSGRGAAAAGALGRPVDALAYLAPEQLDEGVGPIDARADVYSLGATLHACATGRAPFAAPDARLGPGSHAAAPPPLDDATPPELAAVIARCMAPEPAARYPDGAALRAALRPLRSGGASSSGGPAGR